MSDEGLITVASKHPVGVTVERLESAIKGSGLLVFARIDHGANALEVQLPLRPTFLLIFGHPKGGTPLMMENQISGIDLPFKTLVWEDEKGQTWITYNDPAWLAKRHRLGSASQATVLAIQAGMTRLIASSAE
jgi:uncharacterized protein (DUF302 family)